jgi:hypothetical protein
VLLATLSTTPAEASVQLGSRSQSWCRLDTSDTNRAHSSATDGVTVIFRYINEDRTGQPALLHRQTWTRSAAIAFSKVRAMIDGQDTHFRKWSCVPPERGFPTLIGVAFPSPMLEAQMIGECPTLCKTSCLENGYLKPYPLRILTKLNRR